MEQKFVKLDVKVRDEIARFLKSIVVPAQTGFSLTQIADLLEKLPQDTKEESKKVAEQVVKTDDKTTEKKTS
jgi:hypothetical protein